MWSGLSRRWAIWKPTASRSCVMYIYPLLHVQSVPLFSCALPCWCERSQMLTTILHRGVTGRARHTIGADAFAIADATARNMFLRYGVTCKVAHLRTGLGCGHPCGRAQQAGNGLGGGGGAVHEVVQGSGDHPAASRTSCQESRRVEVKGASGVARSTDRSV
jgi:hypothetical protein